MVRRIPPDDFPTAHSQSVARCSAHPSGRTWHRLYHECCPRAAQESGFRRKTLPGRFERPSPGTRFRPHRAREYDPQGRRDREPAPKENPRTRGPTTNAGALMENGRFAGINHHPIPSIALDAMLRTRATVCFPRMPHQTAASWGPDAKGDYLLRPSSMIATPARDRESPSGRRGPSFRCFLSKWHQGEFGV